MLRKRLWGSAAILLVSCCLVYGHTLDIPWYLDDLPAIVDNPRIHSLPGLLQILNPRGIVDLSFALNYHWGQLDPAGYHLVNIALHLCTAGLVLLFLWNICRLTLPVSLFGALLFLLHPVQTQAVNYVVQRSALMATFFALAALLFFFSGMDIGHGSSRPMLRSRFFRFVSILCFILAVWSKQNVVVLPLLLIVTGITWRGWPFRFALRASLPFWAISFLASVWLLIVPLWSGESLQTVASTHALSGLVGNSPLHYLATELSVIFYYFKLLVVPFGLRLSYDWPIVQQPFSFSIFLLFIAHAAVLGLAWTWRSRYRSFSFAVLWFYTALLVESSFIPLDPVFEHRLYLPLLGPIVFCCVGLQRLLKKSGTIWSVAALLLILLGVLSWTRNELWRHPVAFAQDNVRLSPESEGPRVALAGQYLQVDNLVQARNALKRALMINPGYVPIYVNLSSVSLRQGKPEAAFEEASHGLLLSPFNDKLKHNQALAALQTDRPAEGLALLAQLSRRYPDDYRYPISVAQFYAGKRDWINARKWLQVTLSRGTRGDAFPYYLSGTVQYELRDLTGAAAALREAVRLNSQDVASLSGLAYVLLEQGDVSGAREYLLSLEKLDQGAAVALRKTIEQERFRQR